mmetsp:Transcript_8035/g.22941  ORF Transcript_8035/g.22941 Transcript_8035/m.22941 type:complete len:211 (-) Transcript_8035:113-745(-)
MFASSAHLLEKRGDVPGRHRVRREAEADRLGGAEPRAGETQETRRAAAHAAEEGRAAGVRADADGALRHGEGRGLSHEPPAAAHEEARAGAHHDAAPHGHHGSHRAEGLEREQRAVLERQEAARDRLAPLAAAAIPLEQQAQQRFHVPAGAERPRIGALAGVSGAHEQPGHAVALPRRGLEGAKQGHVRRHAERVQLLRHGQAHLCARRA